MGADRKEYFAGYYKENKSKIKRRNQDNKEERAEYQRGYRERLKKNQPAKPNGLKVFHKRIDELNDVCSLYWVVRKYAAVTRFQNRRKRYKQLRKDFEEIQRMRQAA